MCVCVWDVTILARRVPVRAHFMFDKDRRAVQCASFSFVLIYCLFSFRHNVMDRSMTFWNALKFRPDERQHFTSPLESTKYM